jgi:hypothetical protein
MLRDQIRLFVHEDVVEIDVRRLTAAEQSFLPPIFDIIQQPIFMQAAEGFWKRRAKYKDLRLVFDFLLLGSGNIDTRLMMQSISVEFLTNNYLSREEKKLMSSTDFGQIRTGLCAALTSSAMSEDDKEHAWETVRESNRLPFKRKIDKLIEKWSVSMTDIPPETIADLVKVRNAIAYGKILSVDRSTRGTDRVELMLNSRELITRMLFLRMGYHGAYTSFVGGFHSRLSPFFAPMNKRAALQ